MSHKFSSFFKKCVFLPSAQFAYRKGMGYTDALLTLNHHHQRSLNTGIESYFVQLDFSAAFDIVSYSGLLFLFKLKSIGVGGSVMLISREFLTSRWKRVVFVGATSEWIQSFFRATGKCVGSSSVHPIYHRNV